MSEFKQLFRYDPENDLDTDIEVAKYDQAAALRSLGIEPFPMPKSGMGSLVAPPKNETDQYFFSLNDVLAKGADIAQEADKAVTAGIRQGGQEAINTVVEFFGKQSEQFATSFGVPPEYTAATRPESYLKELNDRGFNTELPLSSYQPETEVGITLRELTAFFTSFLLGRGSGKKDLAEGALDKVGNWGYELVRNVRGGIMGEHALNVEEANLSQLAVDLGFTQELNDYFAEGSTADTMAEGLSETLSQTANPEIRGKGDSLSAEARLYRKVDSVMEGNAVGALMTGAIMTAASAVKIASKAPKTTAAAGAALAMQPDEAESAPVTRLARDVLREDRLAMGKPALDDDTLYQFRPDQTVTLDDGTPLPIQRAVDENEIGFYSQAFRAVSGFGQEKMTSQQARKMLLKAGVKPDEMEWTGLNDLLATNDNVTKTQLIDHLGENMVQVDEITLPAADDNAIEAATNELTEELDYIRDNLTYENMTIDEDPGNWLGRSEDYRYDFNKEGSDAFFYDGLIKELSETGRYDADDMAAIKEGIEEYTVDPSKDMSDFVESVGFKYRYLDSDIDDYLEKLAEQEYRENPYYNTSIQIGGTVYNVNGSDDIGYVVHREGSRILDDVYSLNEVQIQVEQAAREYGDLDYIDEDNLPGYARWGEHTEDGGENYRELLLTNDNYKGDPGMYPNNPESTEFSGRLAQFNALGHYDEDNIIYHVRLKDRKASDGGKVLYIEELQSDWAQRGRKLGFYNPAARDAETVKAEIVDIEKQKAHIAAQLTKDYLVPDPRTAGTANERVLSPLTEYDMAKQSPEYKKLMQQEKALNKELNVGRSLPRGPFVQSTDKWSTLAVKRLLRYAAENGYDYIAITPGRVQADRWRNEGLADFYDNILVKNFNNALKKVDTPQGDLFDKGMKVEQIKIPELEDGTRNAIKITPEVKKSIGTGTPLFSAGAATVAAGAAMKQQQAQQQPQM